MSHCADCVGQRLRRAKRLFHIFFLITGLEIIARGWQKLTGFFFFLDSWFKESMYISVLITFARLGSAPAYGGLVVNIDLTVD